MGGEERAAVTAVVTNNGPPPQRIRARAQTVAQQIRAGREVSVVNAALETQAYPEHGLKTLDGSKFQESVLVYFAKAGFTSIDRQISLINRYLYTSEGRDKLFKILQYATQMLQYVLRDVTYKIGSKTVPQRVGMIRSNTSTARKFFKLAQCFEFFRLAFQIFYLEKNLKKKLLTGGRFLGLAGYFFFDHIGWFLKVGFMDGDAKKQQYRALLSQSVSVLCTVILDFQIWLEIAQEKKALMDEKREFERSGGENAVLIAPHTKRIAQLAAKQQQLMVSTVKNVCDGFGCYAFIVDPSIHDGWVGGAGTVSALIGAYRHWGRIVEEEDKAQAKKKEQKKEKENGKDKAVCDG